MILFIEYCLIFSSIYLSIYLSREKVDFSKSDKMVRIREKVDEPNPDSGFNISFFTKKNLKKFFFQ